MKKRILFSLIFLFFIFSQVSGYEIHKPIQVENIHTTSDSPYVVSGYEITNPDGAGIQIREVDYVVIKNNYIHDCGVNISEDRKKKIKERGKTTLAAMNKPFDTGGILVFEAVSVEIYNNEVINNDYGINVFSNRKRAEKVTIYNNKVKDNHRSFFIRVKNADNVDIYDNYVEDNGLGIFFDNKGLMKAFERGEDFPDGRSQGIGVDGCNQVKIFRNTVINSSSDGIAATAGELDLVEDIEIFNNTVLRNNEQGIWIVKAKNGKIHDNTIRENRHRRDEVGGSSGIMFEGQVDNFKVFNNDIGYNDMFGIFLISSSDSEIYGNEIHHNGDGGIGFGELYSVESNRLIETDRLAENTILSENTIIRDNNFHHNRMAAIVVKTDFLGKVIVDNNLFTQNGGNPIHYEDYQDYSFVNHPEDWEYEDDSEILLLENKEEISHFSIGTNIIDGKKVEGIKR